MRIKAMLSFALAVASISGSHATPSQLYGKSIKLSWNETREQKKAGDADFHGIAIGPIEGRSVASLLCRHPSRFRA
jgi:hypothetical protein